YRSASRSGGGRGAAPPAAAPGAPDDWGHGHVHDGSPHGGFYTRTEVRRIVAHAAERHITVVPEIELPGHAQAAIAAYPWLGAGRPDLPVATRWGISPHLLAPSEEVLAFLGDVFGEVADQFPAPYVHVGGDECPPDAWAVHSRARMRVLGASKPDDLRGWFIDQVAERLDGLGRTPLYWYDGAPRSRDAIAVAWQGGDGGLSAAHAGATVIRAPHTQTYLDYRPSADSRRGTGLVLDLDTAHRFQVVPPGADSTVADRFLGGQAQLWTEYAPDRETRDALLLPRLPAVADALWRGQDPARADAFAMALAPLTAALTAAGFGSHEGPDPDEGGADAHPGPAR
ncbi:family 20 glycosylhydrolase, partial [Promicromonospora sp. NPDC023987]|uniref:family 20 glycosylhydrolase n=1 Tax=Promicromonospora sp. NPDC023987 TaxID=3155360 RepID=UPI0033F2900D